MPLPERLGRLQRRERIGAGGFATVWRYHDPDLDSDVAVKTLAENWAARLDVRERFLEEARILRRVDSDHVVRVHDIGEVDGLPYFVMTYADLGPVALLAESGPVPLDVVVDVVAQAGAGLARLHEHGVVHRDVTPHNLLRVTSARGQVRVLVADLGVAKALAHASGLTDVVGTPAFAAPEQSRGVGVDGRADVYALAAVARYLLTAGAGNLGTLAAPVRSVLSRALATDPEDRPRDMSTFVAELATAAGDQDGQPRTVVDRPSPTTVERRRGINWPLVVALTVGAFAVAFAAGFGIVRW